MSNDVRRATPRAWLFGSIALAALAGSLASLSQWRPELYPEGLSSMFPMAVLGLLTFASGFLALSPGSHGAPPADRRAAHEGGRRCLIAGTLLLGYLAAMPLVGFQVATLVFQSLLLRLAFGCSGYGWLLAVPAVATATIMIVFSRLLAIPLPRGAGWFHDLSVLLT